MKQHFERKTPHIFMITLIFCKYNNYLTKAKENVKKYHFFIFVWTRKRPLYTMEFIQFC